MDPADWSANDVSEWLIEKGFQKYSQLLCVEHQIDGQGLLSLTEHDLKQPPIEIRVIGDVKRLMHSIKTLKIKTRSVSSGRNTSTFLNNGVLSLPIETVIPTDDERIIIKDIAPFEIDESLEERQQSNKPKKIDQEKWKAGISLLYLVIAMYITCFSIVIVQEKAPDQHKHPPLPDIFLNHFPQLSWGYKVTDGIIISLTITWVTIVILHKQRFILMRRTFCLMGTMYLLRCACILITQLPVPETNVICDRKNYTDNFERIKRAFQIYFGAGMKVSGLRTCGDYMFSGHTVMLTLYNFLIVQYTTKKFCWLHVASWIGNLFGMFFILAGHGHYSIDVFVAFVLTSRLFLYYHTLANNISLMSRDSKNTKMWFPVFSFFESNSPGLIPNEYEWPLPSWTKVKNYLRGYELVSSKDNS